MALLHDLGPTGLGPGKACNFGTVLFGVCALCAGVFLSTGCDQNEKSVRANETEGTIHEASKNENTAHSLDRFKLRHYELQIASGELARLESEEFSNDTHPATFIAEGKSYPGIKVRIRGSWSRSWPKKSLKIFFEHGSPFDGRRCLNLNSGWRDPAFIREPLAYYVYGQCGVPAPMTHLVRLDVNGKFGGLYVEVEQPDKEFLNRVGLPSASLYKAISRGRDADERDVGSEEALRACYSKETHKSEGYGELQEFCHELRTTTNLVEFFEKKVDQEHYVDYLAATALIQHWDGFNKNHFLLYDGRASQKWLVVPWDLDRTFGDHWNGLFDVTQLPLMLGTRNMPGVTGWNRLEDRFLSEPALRARLFNRLAELLNTEFTEQKLFPVLERMETEIVVDAGKDRRQWPGSVQDVHEGIRQVKTFITERRKFLVNEIERLRRNLTAQVTR